APASPPLPPARHTPPPAAARQRPQTPRPDDLAVRYRDDSRLREGDRRLEHRRPPPLERPRLHAALGRDVRSRLQLDLPRGTCKVGPPGEGRYLDAVGSRSGPGCGTQIEHYGELAADLTESAPLNRVQRTLVVLPDAAEQLLAADRAGVLREHRVHRTADPPAAELRQDAHHGEQTARQRGHLAHATRSEVAVEVRQQEEAAALVRERVLELVDRCDGSA